MGKGCEYIYCPFQLFCHCGGGGVLHGIVSPLPIQCGTCRELVVRGWNHGVSSEIVVAPVIGQYLGLGCFDSVEWPGQHCHCSKNFGSLCFHSLFSLWFLL